MKLLKVSVSGLERFASPFEVDFFATQRVAKDDTTSLFEFGENLYTNNLISFIGLNASGKTSILKVLSFVFEFLNCTPINNSKFKDILNHSQCVCMDSFFEADGFIYLLHSEIKPIAHSIFSEYIISDEYLIKKNANCTKKNLFSFDTFISKTDRDSSAEFLKNDISIVISVVKNNTINVSNLIEYTNLNILPYIGNFPKELVSFLDSSIESIDFSDNLSVDLKFFNRQKITLQSPKQLPNYLSSGTIKGISVFISAMLSFQEGGYLIIDELENHFNHEIVATLIKFFLNNTVNQKGATLIFSTHYPELLDKIDRPDSIYIVRNTTEITATKLSKELNRNDGKKSDIYMSGSLGGTAPSYATYIRLKNAIVNGKVVMKNSG